MATNIPADLLSAIPTDIPLQQQIDRFVALGANLVPEEVVKDGMSPIGQLIESGAAEKALKEDEQAPDFTLPDALGQPVTLSQLLTQGPVIIIFYRGEWCPYCNLELRAYQKALPQLQELGATLVAISPQTPDHSLSTMERHHLSVQEERMGIRRRQIQHYNDAPLPLPQNVWKRKIISNCSERL